ncbi:MAG TPA: 4-hydroxy-tetrahydrodipicolinate reductase [Terriglobia bacterium]|nr:4-hydroxy-tetrahydrodipicolinate reductase [Terriglobia bacterium]
MKIALFGYGKMGHEIEAVAREQGETVAEVFDEFRLVQGDALAGVDVCIDFSTPDAVVGNIRMAIEAKRDIVVGTTGWDKHLPEFRNTVKDSGLLYSSNFSLGMNYFFRLVRRAAEMMNHATDYDPFIHETHHRQKIDSPSGTALTLARILVDGIERKKEILTRPPDGAIKPEMLHVSSTRAGTVAGTHTVMFDSAADSIELTHVAKTRRGFALGAITAARWLHGRKGIYTMDDVEL